MIRSESHRILLVEDDAVVSLAEARMLRKNGYPTVAVDSGEAAIDRFGEDRTIDMVLVDIELGEGMDGVDTARRLLLTRPVPVLFLTGHADSETIDRAATVPHYGYVEKHTSERVLIQAIEMAYRLHDAHRQMRREKENLRATLESVSDAILVSDRAGRIVSCNAGVRTHFGYDVEELIGRWCVSIASAEQRKLHWEAFERALENGSWTIESVCARRDGTLVPVEASFRARADVDGRAMGCVEVVRDLSARREYEHRLEDQREELQRLARHLQRAREDQTAFIAREVHDELGQSLSSMEMHLTILEESLANTESKEVSGTLAELRRILDRTLEKTRQVVSDLRPTVLAQSGLMEGLATLIRGYADYDSPAVELRSAVESVELDREESLAVYRIVQEAVTNAVRHARASHVIVSVTEADGDLRVTVSDDGLGFDLASTPPSHGILGMRERAMSCGCNLRIDSRPEHGTEVSVQLARSNAEHGEPSTEA